MQLPDEVIAQVERRLDVRLDRSVPRTGAWAESTGYRTDRGTWVRVDSRSQSVIQPQSWVGAEAASVIPGIPKPAWLQSATWADTSRERVWQAQEMELVTEPVVAVTGTMLTAPPDLPDTWWAQLRAALADALIAEGICAEITQDLTEGYAGMITYAPAPASPTR